MEEKYDTLYMNCKHGLCVAKDASNSVSLHGLRQKKIPISYKLNFKVIMNISLTETKLVIKN